MIAIESERHENEAKIRERQNLELRQRVSEPVGSDVIRERNVGLKAARLLADGPKLRKNSCDHNHNGRPYATRISEHPLMQFLP